KIKESPIKTILQGSFITESVHSQSRRPNRLVFIVNSNSDVLYVVSEFGIKRYWPVTFRTWEGCFQTSLVTTSANAKKSKSEHTRRSAFCSPLMRRIFLSFFSISSAISWNFCNSLTHIADEWRFKPTAESSRER